jgi:site-specific DNA-methyltransferase (adenine-specific)
VSLTPYYDHGGITIYHGDCRAVLDSLPTPDLVIADPPYGVNLKRGDSRIQDHVAGDTLAFSPGHLLDLAVPLVLFGANAYATHLPNSTGWLVWDKTFPDMAHHSQAELAWTNFVRGIRIFRGAYHGFMRKPDGWLHPTQKPESLFRWILTLPWTPGGLVIDPYMGSGPVMLAAKNLGRRAIGIEIEERYCELVAKRLSQEVLALTPTPEAR